MAYQMPYSILKTENISQSSGVVAAVAFAIPLALIIISGCLCQQWLDKTHKVTNPIKLIIQVLNYTRKHSYPERRSALTYNDEEQPKRMDYGKTKFGGPFNEEEVEDVKTILRLIPLVVTISLCVGALSYSPVKVFKPGGTVNNVINTALKKLAISYTTDSEFSDIIPIFSKLHSENVKNVRSWSSTADTGLCITRCSRTLGSNIVKQYIILYINVRVKFR